MGDKNMDAFGGLEEKASIPLPTKHVGHCIFLKLG